MKYRKVKLHALAVHRFRCICVSSFVGKTSKPVLQIPSIYFQQADWSVIKKFTGQRITQREQRKKESAMSVMNTPQRKQTPRQT